MHANKKPPWLQLYIVALLFFGLTLAVTLLPLSIGWQKVFEILLLLLFFLVLVLWLYINGGAVVQEEEEKRLQAEMSRRRDVPLSPVQAHYLKVMQRYQRR